MGKNKRSTANANHTSVTNTSNEQVKTVVTHKQEKIEEAQEALNITKEEIISSEDKVLMANQCYHNDNACEIGTCSSTLSKYAVFYSNRWFFVIYKRDENKVTSLVPLDFLTVAENNKFLLYKNRLENVKRIARMNTLADQLDQNN